MWGNIVINNVKVRSSFKRGPSLISSNVKLAWSSSWRLLGVNPCPISSPIMLYQTRSGLISYLNLFGLYHPWNSWYTYCHCVSVIDKYNNLYAFWIMDSSYFHLSYWLPHVITNMLTFQIHFMFVPMFVAYWVCSMCCIPNLMVWLFKDWIVRISVSKMGPYIVDISSLPPSKLLGIANGTCVGKCPKIMFFLVQMGSNK